MYCKCVTFLQNNNFTDVNYLNALKSKLHQQCLETDNVVLSQHNIKKCNCGNRKSNTKTAYMLFTRGNVRICIKWYRGRAL